MALRKAKVGVKTLLLVPGTITLNAL